MTGKASDEQQWGLSVFVFRDDFAGIEPACRAASGWTPEAVLILRRVRAGRLFADGGCR